MSQTITALRSRLHLVWLAFGWRGLARRVWYVARLRSGWFRRRSPAASSFEKCPVADWSYRFDLAEIEQAYAQLDLGDQVTDEIVSRAETLMVGEHPLYGWTTRSVGWPPRWNEHPFTSATYPMVHWTRISDDDPDRGDIKDVWELSRFGLTYPLARAFALTGDTRYPEAWWAAVESWAAVNPPNTGVNWRCGQESSLRAISWCFGLSVFAQHDSSTPTRTRLLERLLGATRQRVVPSIGYALSQRNNHAISELVFLLSLPGQPERRYCRLLAEALTDQFFADGSYSQQSPVYERLAVHALAWLVNVQPRLPGPLKRQIGDVLDRAGTYFERISDPVSGEFINYGPNDGTLLFPLAESRPLDARPTLSMLGRDVSSRRAREAAIWLSNKGAAPQDRAASTYATIRTERTLLASRVGGIARRAADADQQAVELFLDGERVAVDPGTFRYSGRAPWRSPFVGLEAHSAALPRVRAAEPSLGRFLRQPMDDAVAVAHEERDGCEVLVSKRRQDDCLLVRAVVRVDHRYAIIDRVAGGDAIVRWNLGVDEPLADAVPTRLKGGATVEFRAAEEPRRLSRDAADPLSGWWSPSYAQVMPCAVVEVSVRDGCQVVALFSPAGQSSLTQSDLKNVMSGRAEESFEMVEEK